MEDQAVASSSLSPVGFGPTVFANGEFATLSNAGSGGFIANFEDDGLGGFVATFGIGDDATNTPTTGLPEGDAFASLLTSTDSGFVAIIEQFPTEEFAEEDFSPFGFGPQSTQFVATSPDMINWTTVELPSLTDSEAESVFFSSVAASGDRVLVAGQVNDFSNDPEQILFEAGLLTEEEVFSLCSTEFTGEEYIVSTCDFENANFDDELEETEVLRVEADDPIFEEISAAFDSQGMPEIVMVVGPAEGPFEIVPSPINGYDAQVAGTSAGFVAVGMTDEGQSQAFSSTDGVTWNEATSPTAENGFFGFATLASNGDTIVALTQDQFGMTASVTTDLGQTWTEGPIPSALFSPFGEVTAGPAGFAVQLQGALEPFDAGFEGDGFDLEKDGYTMSIEFFSGSATLTGPDGVVVHESVLLLGNDVDNVVRFEGPFDENIVWLDPATGEDLITFTEADFEAAFPEPTFDEDFVEPEMAAEVWFSADGTSWTLLSTSDGSSIDSFTGVLAVGDDEVVTFTEMFLEPPAELQDFADPSGPTDEELEALEAWFAEQGDGRTFEIIPIG